MSDTVSGGRVAQEDSVTAFVDVTVIPMDSERTLPGQTVLVEHGKITVVAPTEQVHLPPHVRRIDGRGKFLIPGLSDMHMHLQSIDSTAIEQSLLLFVANGVTTVRNVDYGTSPGSTRTPGVVPSLIQLRARVASGEILGPRIYTSGGWASPTDTVITAEQVKRNVAAYKAQGYDFIKVHDESPDIYQKVVAAASQVGIPIMGHVPDDVAVEDVIAAHQQSIEHLTGYLPMIKDSTKAPAIIAATKAAGVWNCPTMITIEYIAGKISNDLIAQWSESARYTLGYDLQAERNLSAAGVPNLDPDTTSGDSHSGYEMFILNGVGLRGTLGATRRFIKKMQDGGVGLLTGTDSPFPAFTYFMTGALLHHELRALVRAGLTPYQVLAASTRNAASYFGTLKETGTIEVGKRADLVLLEGNPLIDIKNTMHPAGVVINGRWLSRAETDARLANWHPIR